MFLIWTYSSFFLRQNCSSSFCCRRVRSCESLMVAMNLSSLVAPSSARTLRKWLLKTLVSWRELESWQLLKMERSHFLNCSEDSYRTNRLVRADSLGLLRETGRGSCCRNSCSRQSTVLPPRQTTFWRVVRSNSSTVAFSRWVSTSLSSCSSTLPAPYSIFQQSPSEISKRHTNSCRESVCRKKGSSFSLGSSLPSRGGSLLASSSFISSSLSSRWRFSSRREMTSFSWASCSRGEGTGRGRKRLVQVKGGGSSEPSLRVWLGEEGEGWREGGWGCSESCLRSVMRVRMCWRLRAGVVVDWRRSSVMCLRERSRLRRSTEVMGFNDIIYPAVIKEDRRCPIIRSFKFDCMGYSVPDLTQTRNHVIANGVALLLAYAFNHLSQIVAVACYKASSKEQGLVLERLLETSRTLYWFGIATMFSVFPPFYAGIHAVALGWLTLVLVALVHLSCFVRRWDGERSLWSYCYYCFHFSVFLWLSTSLILGYIWAGQQPLASDTNEL